MEGFYTRRPEIRGLVKGDQWPRIRWMAGRVWQLGLQTDTRKGAISTFACYRAGMMGYWFLILTFADLAATSKLVDFGLL